MRVRTPARIALIVLGVLALTAGSAYAWFAMSGEEGAPGSGASAPTTTSGPESQSLPPAPPPPPPADLFVSPLGSDGNPCTEAAPCRTFNAAYQIAAPGEIVELGGGRYPSQLLMAKAGARGPDVVLREAEGARVIVGNKGDTVNCLGFEGAQYVTVVGIETTYTTVGRQRHQCTVAVGRDNARHVTLEDVDAGMLWIGADDVTVLGGDFGPGIDENTKIEFGTSHPPRNILIDGAVIHDARIHESHQECLALWGGHNITVRNTHFYNCEVFHVWINGEAGDVISDVTLENNLFTQPGPNPPPISSTIKVGDHGETLKNIVIRGNRVLVDEMYVLIGYGDDPGRGDVHVLDNEVSEPISLGSGQDCMTDATYEPKPGVLYECSGNTLAGR